MKQQMTLGELAAALRRKEPDKSVRFNFVHFVPQGIHSFRGYYADAAIGYGHGDPKVADVLKLVDGAIGATFTGYKGGHYDMSERTPVWVANDNESSSIAIVDVLDDGYTVTLETHKVD